MSKRLKVVASLLIFCTFMLFVGVSLAAQEVSSEWLAQEHKEHPLVGRFWSVNRQQKLDFDLWLQQRPQGSWLLLGEQHDHPDHQRLARLWLEQLVQAERLGVLAMEMLRASQQPALDEARGQNIENETQLDWPEQGWDWAVYGDLVQAGLLSAERVLAIDLDRRQQLAAYREGAPRPAISQAQAEALDELLYEGHCQMLPRERLGAMRQVQLARDQAMALVMAEAIEVPGVHLLLAGAVHVRQDLGIPRWLPGEVRVVSLLLQQVDPERKEPEAYLPASIDGLQAFDYIFFTPAIEPVDYCAKMRASQKP